jgi:hypothetical protein
MAPIVGDGFELFPTRSELRSIPEMGCVFHDRTGTFWNQVDTPLAPATMDGVRERFSGVDLLFAMYASQNLEFFESLTTRFPTETHQQNLEAVVRIAPRTAVPASAGFRFCGTHEWPVMSSVSRDPTTVCSARTRRIARRTASTSCSRMAECGGTNSTSPAQRPRVTDGSGVGPRSDLVHRIAASALTGWSRHARSFFSVRASSRRSGEVRQPVRDRDGVRLETHPLPDLLMYYLLRKAEGSELAAKHEVDHQLGLLRDGGATRGVMGH